MFHHFSPCLINGSKCFYLYRLNVSKYGSPNESPPSKLGGIRCSPLFKRGVRGDFITGNSLSISLLQREKLKVTALQAGRNCQVNRLSPRLLFYSKSIPLFGHRSTFSLEFSPCHLYSVKRRLERSNGNG